MEIGGGLGLRKSEKKYGHSLTEAEYGLSVGIRYVF
jgi:hypothetical protein